MDEAQHLRIQVKRDGEIKVDLHFPARVARWILEIVPGKVLEGLRAKGIKVDEVAVALTNKKQLYPEEIFFHEDPERTVRIWLE